MTAPVMFDAANAGTLSFSYTLRKPTRRRYCSFHTPI